MRKRLSFGKILAVLAVIFVGFTGYRMATLDTELKFVREYELPELVDLSEIASVEYGQEAVAVDGKIVSERNNLDQKTQPTASTTKMILSLAVLTKKPLQLGESGEIITITAENYARYQWYVANNGSVTAVTEGEEISEYDALVSVMLASSNNMADTLAEWAFGSLDEYREYASEMLAGWGLSETVLGPDASGYNAGTVSTAGELALIGQKVLENPVLKEIVGTKSATVPVAGEIANTNLLLGENGVVGIKTGYIGEDVSGYCLISAYIYEGHVVTVALLGAPTRAESFTESRRVITALQDKLKLVEMVTEGEKLGYYESWWDGKIDVVAEEGAEMLGWKGAETEVELDGEKLRVRINGQEKTVPVKATAEVRDEPNLWERLLRAW